MPSLHWIGKEAVVNHHHAVPFHLLRDVPELSVGEPGAGNLIVQGDNLVALKALLPYYAGQVKCIYIDPPYNTGNEGWIYNDNVNSPVIRKWLGQVVGKEGETLDRHDRWLCLMHPRLALLRQFLRDDGAIFVSLDDNEVQALRYVMDEIFGQQNFVSTIIWQKKYSASNDHKSIAPMHDYVVVYRRSEKFHRKLMPRTTAKDRQYRFEDEGGIFRISDYKCNKSAGERPNLFYAIKNPNTDQEVWPKRTRVWAYSQAVHDTNNAEGLVFWGKDGKATAPSFKRYRSSLKGGGGTVPATWWDHEFADHTDGAKKELREVFGADSRLDFFTPKPTRLIERVLQICTNPGDLVLDSFAGSGTTGHAVLKMNAELAANASAPNPKGIPSQSPGLAQRAYPGNTSSPVPTPTGLRPANATGHNPVGVESSLPSVSQGSSSLATLGCTPESLWDSNASSGSESGPGANGPAPRRFLLVEMESNIARDITAKRVKRVAQGYTNAKGEQVAGLGGGFRFCELGEPLFDETGKIRASVRFVDLARHVYFTETGEPLPELVGDDVRSLTSKPNGKESQRLLTSSPTKKKSPLLGIHHGRAVCLLYNGILKDKSPDGGNALTQSTLAILRAASGGQRVERLVVYGTSQRLSPARLKREGVNFKQIPYSIRIT